MKATAGTLISRVSHWGVTPELSPSFSKRIILTNILGCIFGLNMFVSGVCFLWLGYYNLTFLTLFFVISELCWPVFNRYKMYDVSRIGILVLSNLLGFCVSVLLPDTGYNRGFLVMAGLPILIFGLEEKKSILLGFLLPILLYPLSEWAQYQLPPLDPGFELSEFTKSLIFYSTSLFYVTLIFLMFLFLSRENSRAEELLGSTLKKVESEKQKIEDLIHQLEEERARSFSSAKFAALGEMASGIAHEINNPMMVININTEHLKFILKEPSPDKDLIFRRIEVISNTVARVAKIIDSMRNFSRVAEEDEFQTESVKKIIEDTLTFCSERFKNHNVRLDVAVAPENLLLNCRTVQISQVILNLLNNAFDAVEPAGNKWIRLAAQEDEESQKVLITVTDSGTGVSVAEREKIFQPFYTTKPPGKGTGLGLTLSAKIIADHGGTLELDQSSGHTQFVIELPSALTKN